MHKRFLSTILLVAVMLVARPAFAETNLGSLEALIQSLMVQVQELQRQLVILQSEAGGSTTASSSSAIMVLYPNGGETLKFGTMIDVVWTAPNTTYQQQYFDLYVQAVGADANKRFLLNSAIPMDGTQTKQTYEWEVGTRGAAGAAIPLGYYYMEVCPWSHGEYSKPPCDRSNQTFKIVDNITSSPRIKVTSPNGGEELRKATYYQIGWTYSPLPPTNFAINLLNKAGTEAIAHLRYCDSSEYGQHDYPNANRFWFNWKVGYDADGNEIPSGSYRVRVSNCGDVSDKSDSSFEIVGDSDQDASIDISNPVGGERYIPGEAIPVSFEVYSSDGTPDVSIKVLKHTEGKDLVVNQAYYRYEDGFIQNGKNTINFYPAKGSSYSTDELIGEFRLEVIVGEIFCCKYWIEPADADITNWFNIGYFKSTTETDKSVEISTARVLGASASYRDVLNQMAATLKGMQELLQGLK